MAFQLRNNESLSDGFRRLARKELERARREIRRTKPPRDEAVHSARRSLKKVRAILQLIVDDDGSGVRARAWHAVERQLARVRRVANGWRPAHRGPVALARGIQAAHQRGRKAMKRARKRQRADDFHAWRKEMKALWYALRLVGPSDSTLQHEIRALRQAETWLGDEHNLVVLCDELSRDSQICTGPVDRDRLRLVVDRDQCRLREKAISHVTRLYQRHSGVYARRVARRWKGWRTQQ